MHSWKGNREIVIPLKNGEGCYIADEKVLDQLEAENRVVARYVDVNPNGSRRDIAGITNEKGNVVFMGADGLMVGNLSEMIKQPTEFLLYDLNRDEATIFTFLPDIKWINDLAVSQVIRALKNKVEELENELKIKKQ